MRAAVACDCVFSLLGFLRPSRRDRGGLFSVRQCIEGRVWRPCTNYLRPSRGEFRAGSDVPSILFGLDAASLVSRQGSLNSCFQITLRTKQHHLHGNADGYN